MLVAWCAGTSAHGDCGRSARTALLWRVLGGAERGQRRRVSEREPHALRHRVMHVKNERLAHAPRDVTAKGHLRPNGHNITNDRAAPELPFRAEAAYRRFRT